MTTVSVAANFRRAEMRFDISVPANAGPNIYKSTAIRIAYGIALPDDFAAWPLGLRIAWDGAVDDGAFDDLGDRMTVVDMAKAFLRNRIGGIGAT